MTNKKAEAFRKTTKNQQVMQTAANTDHLQKLGELVIPMSMKLFNLEQQVQKLENKLREAKAGASLAEYKAIAIQKLLGLDANAIRESIVSLQKEDFQRQSDADDKARNLTTVEGPAKAGQIAIVSGKIFKGEVELENEEIMGSKLNLGDEDLYQGIDEQVVGMNVGETKKITFTAHGQEYSIVLTLSGLREQPAIQPQETQDEAAEAN